MSDPIDTGTDDLVGYRDGPVAVLEFNRPDRRNALSIGIYDGFERALPRIADDPSIRVLMLTGRGSAFCAGGDVKGMNERNQLASSERPPMAARVADLRRRQRLVSHALRELPQPVVAALPGATAGAGLSIALAADLRVASPDALIVTAFGNVGASGDFGGSFFLTRLVGEAKAKELYFFSPRLGATEALDLGLVNAVLDDDDFGEAALAYCRRLAERPPLAMTRMKENINRAFDVGIGDALDAEAPNMAFTMASADHAEAARAFVEKRTPTFEGH